MDYALAIDDAPASVPDGTGLLLLHPSTGETDRIDTDFLRDDTDNFLVVSTRTTAREVRQKLDHYDVDEQKAVILDTLSVERGYSRRSGQNVHYVSSPDDLDGIVEHTRRFLESHDGKVRVSFDSITELAYYADDEDAVFDTVRELLDLIRDHDAVGLFHLSSEVHDDPKVDRYRDLFDGVLTLHDDDQLDADL
jgi:KaiC/GvpD/RAD55 family RecA-like ATPase